MKNGTFALLAVVLVAAVTAVCLASTMLVVRITVVPSTGPVIVKGGAEGCKIFDEKLGEWEGCSKLPKSTVGIRVNKEGYAHVYAGRIRVQFEYEGYPGVFVYRWYQPADIETP